VKRYIAQSRDLFNEKQVSTTFTSKSCNDLKTIYFEGPELIKVSATSFKMVHEQSSVLRPISGMFEMAYLNQMNSTTHKQVALNLIHIYTHLEGLV